MASYVDIPLPRAPATSGRENYVMRAIDLNLMVRVPQAAGEVDGFFMLSSRIYKLLSWGFAAWRVGVSASQYEREHQTIGSDEWGSCSNAGISASQYAREHQTFRSDEWGSCSPLEARFAKKPPTGRYNWSKNNFPLEVVKRTVPTDKKTQELKKKVKDLQLTNSHQNEMISVSFIWMN